MMYPEALLHPEVKPLDEGFCLLLLTLAQCPSIQQSALVTTLSDALSLDEVNLLTLRVISILSVCASQNLSGSHFTWCCFYWRLGLFYFIRLRQSKSNRKQFHFRLKHSLVLRFCVPNSHGLSYFPVIYLLMLGDENIHPHAQVLIYPEVNLHPEALLLGILCYPIAS